MRFADKLFLSMTALMTFIFTVFGVWIMTSYFSQILNRELERGELENQMFQYVFEIAYKTVPEEYGSIYALERASLSVKQNLNAAGNFYYIFTDDYEFSYGETFLDEKQIKLELAALSRLLTDDKNFGRKVFQGDVSGQYYLLGVARSNQKDLNIYLVTCQDISRIFIDRDVLLNQYRFVLTLLVISATLLIFLLSRYITRPIGSLNMTARQIAKGNLSKRDHNKSSDEIGELSRNFNEMADALVERMREKEQEAKQKEDFTAAFAHEIKTPLTAIIGYADMINTIQMTDAEKSEAVYYIFTQGKRLERLSYKLLELVNIEKTTMTKKPVQTKELEEVMRNTIRPLLRDKKIQGRILLEKDKLYGDKDLLLSLLYNLLDNAVKAVESGGFVLLKGTCTDEGYEFKVVDNGRGIPREEIARITEAFYMVDKSRSRKEGGAGIGMALCQKIVTLHQGHMEIDSRLGEGTVVKIFLPKNDREDGT